jgi:PPOX class probable FMN-dependent enzyme
MPHPDPAFDIADLASLEALFGAPTKAALIKQSDRIIPAYRAWIEAAPFVALATAGTDHLDCSPRGDRRQAVQVLDERTLVLPDRRGNNRIDSLRNILHDPRVALLFLIPGIDETLRVSGRARISVDPALLAAQACDGVPPRVVVVIEVEAVFFTNSRSVQRAGLWDAACRIDRGSLPSPGRILEELGNGAIDGAEYDRMIARRAEAARQT